MVCDDRSDNEASLTVIIPAEYRHKRSPKHHGEMSSSNSIIRSLAAWASTKDFPSRERPHTTEFNFSRASILPLAVPVTLDASYTLGESCAGCDQRRFARMPDVHALRSHAVRR